MLIFALACATTPEPTDSGDTADTADTDSAADTDTATDTGDPFEPPAVEVVTLTTSDGVDLVGDYYAHREGAEAVLLLHMIPPTYDRTTWPVEFIEALRDDGYAVLALDRRGAGDSGGVASEAYAGPNGVKDAEAAAAFFADHGATSLVVVAASNGTTTALDYAIAGEGLAPRAMVWMSPGTYTENNHDVADLALADVLFLYPRNEAGWSEGVAEDVDTADRWDYLEYQGTAHGTMLFEDHPEVSDDVRAWLGAAP